MIIKTAAFHPRGSLNIQPDMTFTKDNITHLGKLQISCMYDKNAKSAASTQCFAMWQNDFAI